MTKQKEPHKLATQISKCRICRHNKFGMKTYGKILEREGQRYFLTIHPEAALRFPPNRKILVQDFNKLKKYLNTPSLRG